MGGDGGGGISRVVRPSGATRGCVERGVGVVASPLELELFVRGRWGLCGQTQEAEMRGVCGVCAGRGGAVGNKFRMSVGMPTSGVMNCADNSGTPPAQRRCPLLPLHTGGGTHARTHTRLSHAHPTFRRASRDHSRGGI